MKYLLAFVFVGCTLDASEPAPYNYSAGYNEVYLPPTNHVGTNECMTPVNITITENGKEVIKTLYFPCFAQINNFSKASDPPGWGNDNYGNTVGNPIVNPPAPGDPVPYKK